MLSISAGYMNPKILMPPTTIYLQTCRGRQKKRAAEDKSCIRKNKIKSFPTPVEALRHGIIIMQIDSDLIYFLTHLGY